MMLPIFSLWRSGNISTHAVDKYFGPLRIALKVKKYSLFVGLALSGVSLLAGLGVYLRMRKQKKQDASIPTIKNADLMISLQPNVATTKEDVEPA